MTDRDEDDLTAAEFALGTLDAAEREAAARRVATEPGFAALVAAWEARLAPLGEGGREAEPPAGAWEAVLRRLGLAARSGTGEAALAGRVLLLERGRRRWRAAALATGALAAGLALVVAAGAWRAVTRPEGPSYVAFLQPSDAPPAYVLGADLNRGSVAVRIVSAAPPPGRSNQLWIIDPQLGAPRSLGLLDARQGTHPLPPGSTPDVLVRATFAVTEEPAGGSPTGAPTAAPIYLGHLVRAAF